MGMQKLEMCVLFLMISRSLARMRMRAALGFLLTSFGMTRIEFLAILCSVQSLLTLPHSDWNLACYSTDVIKLDL